MGVALHWGGHLCFSFPGSDACLPLSCLPLCFDKESHSWLEIEETTGVSL